VIHEVTLILKDARFTVYAAKPIEMFSSVDRGFVTKTLKFDLF